MIPSTKLSSRNTTSSNLLIGHWSNHRTPPWVIPPVLRVSAPMALGVPPPFMLAPHWVLPAHTMESVNPLSAACIVDPVTTSTTAAPVWVLQSSAKLKTASGGMWKATLTALITMAHVPAHVRTLVHTYMPVPCVSREIMLLNHAVYDSLFPICTKLCWTAWRNTLSSIGLVF